MNTFETNAIKANASKCHCNPSGDKNKGKDGFSKAFVLTITVVIFLQILFLSLLTLCAILPKSIIEDNIKKSADYYSNKYMFQQITKEEDSTIVHNYADLVWLNIAWHQDSDAPLASAVAAKYYEGEDIYKSESLIKAVYDDAIPDKSYSRYWHGALIFIKPLLAITDISGIRMINVVVCILLILFLSAMLIKRRLYAVLIGYIVSIVMSFTYIIPLCMEYMPAFVLMHIACIIILAHGCKIKSVQICMFFASFGALTCFFDFLTNEILTLFMPLIFLICMCEKEKDCNGKNRIGFKQAAVHITMWFFGYAFTWVSKWIISGIVLGKEAFVGAISDGAYRMMGGVPSIEENQLIGAVVKNINRLFPFNFLKTQADVWIAVFVVGFVLFCIFFLYRKEKISKTVWLLLLIACTPYVRYLFFSNHSFMHPFFTFRTQIITVTALFAAFGEGIEFDLIFKRGKKAWARKHKKTKSQLQKSRN